MKKTLLLLVIGFWMMQSYAQPTGYYNQTENLTGDDLKTALNDIIKDHVEFSYFASKTIFKLSDADPDNSDNVILVYTGRSEDNSNYGIGGNYINREHVWAKSHGNFVDVMPMYSDVHNLKPADASVNVDRSNLDFDNGGTQHPEATGCYYDSDSWEARDEVKGDVARMIFYMAVRYEGENGELDLVVVDEVNTYPNPEHGKLSALLEWNTLDPPSVFEETRNDRIYDNWQGNRNPFVDHPEFADLIWEITSTQSEYFTENKYNLSNYPNPFSKNSTGTQISFSLPNNSQNVQIEIYNIKGQKVKSFPINQFTNSPIHQLIWDGTDMNNRKIRSGIYMINLKIDSKNAGTKKCLVIY